MPIDTLNNMILGFSVIIGILLLYAVSLFVRYRRKKRSANQKKSQTKA
jgi:hypothetical protein